MPPDYKSTLDELVKAREEAREVLKELHGVLKDCKRAKAEVVQLLNRGTAIMVMTCLNEELDKVVDKVDVHLGHTIDEAVKRVATRFSELTTILDLRQEQLDNTVETVQETVKTINMFMDSQRRKI